MNLEAALDGLYQEYLAQVDDMMRSRSLADGLLGMGNAPQHAPCHAAFDERLEALLHTQPASDPQELAAAVTLMLRAEQDRPAPECAAWMMIAAQRHSLLLIPHLPAEAAASLLAWYTNAYPFYRRLPVQKEVIRRLKACTK